MTWNAASNGSMESPENGTNEPEYERKPSMEIFSLKIGSAIMIVITLVALMLLAGCQQLPRSTTAEQGLGGDTQEAYTTEVNGGPNFVIFPGEAPATMPSKVSEKLKVDASGATQTAETSQQGSTTQDQQADQDASGRNQPSQDVDADATIPTPGN